MLSCIATQAKLSKEPYSPPQLIGPPAALVKYVGSASVALTSSRASREIWRACGLEISSHEVRLLISGGSMHRLRWWTARRATI